MDYELTLSVGSLRLAVSSASDLGLVRKVNEDSFFADPPVFVVADGMGGHSFGDRASQSVAATFAAASPPQGLPSVEDVVSTIRDSNSAVVGLAGDDVVGTVSGTTLAGLALIAAGDDCHWMAFNVGDSRVYSWDGRVLEQVTVDHSAVQELLDLGEISLREVATHPFRNVVTRAIGVGIDVDPDVWLLPLGGRQLFLVCSDGLTKELDDDQIASILADRFHLPEGQSVADRLVAAALAAGGSDNVTVVVVDSELVGSVHTADEETVDRGMPHHLEETRPRK